MAMTTYRSGAAVLLIGLLVGGCGNLGVPATRFSFFDLGLAEPVEPPLPVALTRVEVRTPSWLSTGAMQYLMAYREPAQREAYSETRWVAEPAEMLRLALDRALAADGSAVSRCRLRLELDEFVQEFENVRDSHAIIIARPMLIAPRSDDVVAQAALVIREPAPTPDASGGVLAHRRATARLAGEISGWLAGLDRTVTQGSNILERCRQ